MKNHISRQEDRMDGLEDAVNLCFQENNDLEQYTRKSSIRITSDKNNNCLQWYIWFTFINNITLTSVREL